MAKRASAAQALVSSQRGHWSWVQFSVTFVVASGIAFLYVTPPLIGLGSHLAKTAVLGLLCAVAAGRYGDAAWHAFARVFRVW